MQDNAVRGGAFLTLVAGLVLVALALTEGFREAAMVVAAIATLMGIAIFHAGLVRQQGDAADR